MALRVEATVSSIGSCIHPDMLRSGLAFGDMVRVRVTRFLGQGKVKVVVRSRVDFGLGSEPRLGFTL